MSEKDDFEKRFVREMNTGTAYEKNTSTGMTKFVEVYNHKTELSGTAKSFLFDKHRAFHHSNSLGSHINGLPENDTSFIIILI